MTLKQRQADYLPQIEQTLQSFLEKLDFADSQPLKDMLREHMGWESTTGTRGKRIRPFLTMLCVGALNGNPHTALPGAAAIEFLHNFTLIHDDIEDNSLLRHGRPTLWTTWGLAQAINAGDALFCVAQLCMLSLHKTCGDTVARQAGARFNEICLHLTRGQHLDIAFETLPRISISSYQAMIEGKTAALIAFSAELAGIITGQPPGITGKLSRFGRSLGLAFQIQDDALGIWGDPTQIGKSTASDLTAGKKSLPVLYGLTHCPEFKKRWDESPITEDEVTSMSDLLANCGARDYTHQQAAQHTKDAFHTLANIFKNPNEDAKAIQSLAETLLNRQV